MALITTQKLYIDIERGVAYARWNNFSSAPTPVFYEDDTAQLELYLVRQTNSNAFPMESVTFPTSTIAVGIGAPGSAAAASGTTWTAISAPAATFSAPNLTVPVADIISGSYTLTIANTSPALSVTTTALTATSTPADIQTAIQTAINSASGWTVGTASVTQTSQGKFVITAKGTNSTTVYNLTITVTSSLQGPAGYKGEVAFTAAAIDTLLGTSAEVTSTIEIQCTDDSKVQTYYQAPCIVRQVINPIA